ncbi:MAG: DUF5790 family protein [Halorhabdus sp.]
MSQTTLDDEDLFGEAASEMRDDVEEQLAATRAALPDVDTIWTIESENTLGVLNALRSGLDPGDAQAHLRDAKKWYTMGERAGAFEESDDLESEIAELEEIVENLLDAHEQVSDLASTIPELKSVLESTGEEV